jgi:enoyl-CoA hydratase/carnithine racemase
MTMTNSPVIVETDASSRVTLITLNRPHVLNALDRRSQQELAAAIEDFHDDPHQRVAILTGAGERAFSVGGDLKEMARSSDAGQPPFEARRIDKLVASKIEQGPKPMIAAIDGLCVANGLELALACDIRVSTKSSQFGLPEVVHGMLAGPGLVALRRQVPLGEALLLHLTGDVMGAERAHAIGLVQRLHDDKSAMLASALELAERIAGHEPHVVQTIRDVVRGRDRPLEVAMRAEIDALTPAIANSDAVRRNVTNFRNRKNKGAPQQ